MTLSTPKIKCFLKKEFLYDGDSDYHDEFVICYIIGVSAYKNQPLSFNILINDEYLYSNIPIHALQSIDKNVNFVVNFNDLAFIDSPEKEIELIIFEHLKAKINFNVFLKYDETWLHAKQYFFSIDFYTDNELLHFIELDNGNFALIPNHKINWKGKRELSDYKKQTKNYKIWVR